MSTPAAMLAKRNSVRGMATLKGAAAIPADDQHKEDVDANARPGLMRTGSITSLNSINSITSISSTASAVTPNKPKSSDARRITIIAELIDTERNYLNYLNMIVNVFMNPLRASMRTSKPLIDPEQFKKLFSNLEAIIECNTPLFDALNNRWKNWNSRQCIGDTFLGVLKSLKAYTVYVNFFQLSKKTLETCETQSAFREFLKICQARPECHRQTLKEMLILPVQRVPRYVLLLQEVLKHTPQDHPDHVHLNEAIVTIREIVNEINEAKRKTEQQMELFELIQSIEDCPPTLLSANRQVLARVNVMRLATENEDYDANAAGSLVDTIGACLIDMTIVLFNDAVEVVKRRRAGFRQKTPYRHVNHADIRDIHIVDVADAPAFANVFGIVFPDVCHVYQATSSEEKQQFMAKLAKCQEANGVEEEVSCITNPLAEVAVGAGHKLKRSNTMMKTLGKVTGKILSRSSSMREEKPQSLSAASGRASASAATGSISSPRVKPARRSAMDVFPPAATTAAASTPSLLAPVAEATAPATPTTSVAPSTPKRSDSSVGTTTPSRAAPLSNPRLSSGLGTLKLKPTTPSSSTTKPPKEVMSTQHAERVEEPLSIEDDVFLQVQSLEMAIRQTAHKRAILHSGNNSLGTSPGSPRGRIASFPAPALSSNLDVSSVQDLLNNLQSIRSPSGDGKDSAMPRPSLGGNRRRTSFMPAPAAKVEPAKDEAALILDEADDDVPELEELNFDDSAMDALTAVQRSRRISSGAVNRQLHAMLLESKQATPADTPVKSAQTTPVKMGSGMARSPASAHSPSGHPRSSMGTPMSNERRSSSGVYAERRWPSSPSPSHIQQQQQQQQRRSLTPSRVIPDEPSLPMQPDTSHEMPAPVELNEAEKLALAESADCIQFDEDECPGLDAVDGSSPSPKKSMSSRRTDPRRSSTNHFARITAALPVLDLDQEPGAGKRLEPSVSASAVANRRMSRLPVPPSASKTPTMSPALERIRGTPNARSRSSDFGLVSSAARQRHLQQQQQQQHQQQQQPSQGQAPAAGSTSGSYSLSPAQQQRQFDEALQIAINEERVKLSRERFAIERMSMAHRNEIATRDACIASLETENSELKLKLEEMASQLAVLESERARAAEAHYSQTAQLVEARSEIESLVAPRQQQAEQSAPQLLGIVRSVLSRFEEQSV